ncbi:MAG: hypothetical protein SFY81_01360, partial [Verrucomicrobiota bacterium]|nr:hypothetical protein [Verrucomicrobiota bacterium]
MKKRFLLGPAGSGKTFQCLAEARACLRESQRGKPLLFIAPKQATYQLERELLSADELVGFSRLHIVSFERLARFVFDKLGLPVPEILSEPARVMALKALLLRHQEELSIFSRAARKPGFAAELSNLLREFQEQQLTPTALRKTIQLCRHPELKQKLQDFALIWENYSAWLTRQSLIDSGDLLESATRLIIEQGSALQIEAIWLDGFAQMTPQERGLFRAITRKSEAVTIAFCLPGEKLYGSEWQGPWHLVHQSFLRLRNELASIGPWEVEVLELSGGKHRFIQSPTLFELEKGLRNGVPMLQPAGDGLKIVSCLNVEEEAQLAVDEILRFVRSGGRFREVAVLVRSLDAFASPLQRALNRYRIPLFLDRREPIAHHPISELTRGAMRLARHGWNHEDIFRTLKSGLCQIDNADLYWFENCALSSGWTQEDWEQGLALRKPDPSLQSQVANIYERLMLPLLPFLKRVTGRVSGIAI